MFIRFQTVEAGLRGGLGRQTCRSGHLGNKALGQGEVPEGAADIERPWEGVAGEVAGGEVDAAAVMEGVLLLLLLLVVVVVIAVVGVA